MTRSGAAALGAIEDSLLRRLYQDWDDCRSGGVLPDRKTIDPLRLRFILGHLALIEVFRGPRRFRIRLHGTELVGAPGGDFTGKFLDEIPVSELRELAQQWFATAADASEPYHQKIRRVIDGYGREFELLVLPYAGRSKAADLLMIAIRCRDQRRGASMDA